MANLVKNIRVREETYRKLLSAKRKDESFSDLLNRLARKEFDCGNPERKSRGARRILAKEKKKIFLSEIYVPKGLMRSCKLT